MLAAQRCGALLIDLRSHDERVRHGVVPGSLHIPRSVLEWRLDPDCGFHNPCACGLDRVVVVFCADGYSSSLAAANLRELGYRHATDLIGGFSAWSAQGLPLAAMRERAPDEIFGMGKPDGDVSARPMGGIVSSA